ncbi:MAG: pyruvate, phosphate dikinase [Oscillospiraceae bacterium]|nr:pyruvate, phosphate dikinase [Oscillospiraceae bacterium]MCC8156111.1 pyruvate, phosphate dikinase [Oscillospiraceae bacterium]MCD8128577.1 pyruvate, phosphate dikinase [Oscillospiraceae bacterium]
MEHEATRQKYVYLFSEGNAEMRELLGGKGANLAEMTRIGLPVPQGFTITTEACNRYYTDGRQIAPEIEAEIFAYLEKMEELAGKKLGDTERPLLVSVRSGARASMPGMMDTILNLGMNDGVAAALVKLTGNPRFVYDAYRRFIQMFSDVVMELPKSRFEAYIDAMKVARGVQLDSELTAADMQELVRQFKDYYRENQGTDFPQDPREQLLAAVRAVFRSWDNPRANVYRRMNDIPYAWGTAVNVQEMVFGNMGEDSGTGVAFTRNPATGEKRLYGEFLMNAQGEDVVAGIRTPQAIERLREVNPDIYAQFAEIADTLERHYRDMQDMEFTIERGRLYMLQTRNGKRTAQAAFKIAADLVAEGLCTREEALLKIEPKQLDALLHPRFDAHALENAVPVATGLAASPGAGCGAICFTAETAKERSKEGPVVLVRLETSPEDIEGMAAAQGILTARGGMTSHAAVVARGMGACCVVGCSALSVHAEEGYILLAGNKVHEGDFISLDGTTGNIYLGVIPTVDADESGDFATIMGWADEVRRLDVRANADNPRDAATALRFGAQGIGLTRTEHMFFAENRIAAMREMIISRTPEQRRAALAKILPMQRDDFVGIFRVMGERPVTIRLLDPPLHEFLPTADADIEALSAEMGVSFDELKATVVSLHEVNPMMGLRGCRLPILYPEIAEMQTQAIIEAAIQVSRETGMEIQPEIMVPLVGAAGELRYMRNLISNVADKLIGQSGLPLHYRVGTMVELPRAAISADRIAEYADFFSFGTNDLTQMTFGFSRDDAGKFLPNYLEKKILEHDPFVRFDELGTGRLVEMATKLGREKKPDIHLGVCGEHGGDPASVQFFHNTGLDYVSCSPFRVPVARLAAAQAQIRNPRD